MKLDILAFGAHPDDVELGCGGSIALSIKQGKKVGIIDLTEGELGTRGNKKIRLKEAQKASSVLGVLYRHNLKFRDGFFINDEKHQLSIISLLRDLRPEIVLCNAISDRHIDHSRASKLVSDSCFLSGLSKIQSKSKNGDDQIFWRPPKIYHYIQWDDLTPDFVINISKTIDVKIEAILKYKSQFYNPESKENSTPISSKNFIDSVKYRAFNLGRLVGVEAGEGFTVERYLAVNSFDNLI
ncbi:MAG: bacillithiol biosynthesis deacetylase BshB1 [Flavobacteriaceae bacterium]|nr:bacillithiol biosynthesis deacetylase BshB1 [Flavobacteriaceae bacterium]